MLKTIPFSSNPPVILRFFPEVHSYGFNGKEKDNEHTSGNYDFGARILDARLGRWLSVDAATRMAPHWTPYRFGFNNPISITDPDGNYEVKGVVSKSEKSEIKAKHSGEKGGKRLAKNEIRELAAQRVEAIHNTISLAKSTLQNDPQAKKAFEEFSGIKENSEDWENLFENNGKGPLVYFDPNLKSENASGLTNMYKGIIQLNENSSIANVSNTYLHELIHYCDPKDGVINDDLPDGIPGISWSGEFQRSALQDVLDWSLENHPIDEKRKLENWIKHYPNSISALGKVSAVEVGYAFEKAAFGSVLKTDQELEDYFSKRISPIQSKPATSFQSINKGIIIK